MFSFSKDCSNAGECESCPGGAPFNSANQCDAFVCVDAATSCNNKGECNADKTACTCQASHGHIDCSIEMPGNYI